MEEIELDGSLGLGRGTNLRTALILSAVLNKSFRMKNMLTHHSPQGLKQTHLKTIHVFADATGAEVKGVEEDSTELCFEPTKSFSLKKATIEVNENSLSLILHPLLIAGVFSEQKLKIRAKGGTHRKNAPPISFLRETILRYLRKYVDDVQLSTQKISFTKDDEGEVELVVKGKTRLDDVRPIVPKADRLVMVKIDFYASKQLEENGFVEQLAKITKLSLKNKKTDFAMRINTKYAEAKDDVCEAEIYAFYGTEEGFDNTRAVIKAKTLRAEGEELRTFEELFLKEINDFTKDIDQPSIDISSAELLFPLIALIGGELPLENAVGNNEKNNYAVLQGQIQIANAFLGEGACEIQSKDVCSVLVCKGYSEMRFEGAISIDDL